MSLFDADRLKGFLDALMYDEEPMGIFYSDEAPTEGISPKPTSDLPTREKELRNEIDWQGVFKNFNCAIGVVWRARKKGVPAYFDHERFGCPGCAFYGGFLKPQTEFVIHFVSTGIPGQIEGERYFSSPDECRANFEFLDPRPAPKRYLIIKPITQFEADEVPELVAFFCRPEIMSGVHQLTRFVTGDNEPVISAMGAGCATLITWPLHYLERGLSKAVVGGWDPSARKYFKVDELSLTLPWSMFRDMVEQWDRSFLTSKNWEIVQKRITRGKRTWGELSEEHE
jgi:uncharacterized protein (DUF169 family)